MEKTKLVSVRLDAKDVDTLDQIAERMVWRKRTDLIQYGVKLIIEAEKKGILRDVFNFKPSWGDVCDKFEFDYHRQKS